MASCGGWLADAGCTCCAKYRGSISVVQLSGDVWLAVSVRGKSYHKNFHIHLRRLHSTTGSRCALWNACGLWNMSNHRSLAKLRSHSVAGYSAGAPCDHVCRRSLYANSARTVSPGFAGSHEYCLRRHRLDVLGGHRLDRLGLVGG